MLNQRNSHLFPSNTTIRSSLRVESQLIAYIFPFFKVCDLEFMYPGISQSDDKSSLNSPSLLTMYVVNETWSDPPKTAIPSLNPDAARNNDLLIQLSTGSCFHSLSASKSILSIEFRRFGLPWVPQKANALGDSRRTLPCWVLPVFRGAMPLHLSVLRLYLSQVFTSPWFQPPSAIK